MKVYSFYANTYRYQYFLPKSLDDEAVLVTNCTSRSADWQPPALELKEPTHVVGDFFELHKGSPILSARAVDRLRPFLELAGELLPLPYGGETFYLFNVVPCTDCLDADAAEWRMQYNKRMWPDKYVFTAAKFGPHHLFKIPQTCRAEVLVLDREDVHGFVEALAEHQLLGYTLDLLWCGG